MDQDDMTLWRISSSFWGDHKINDPVLWCSIHFDNEASNFRRLAYADTKHGISEQQQQQYQ